MVGVQERFVRRVNAVVGRAYSSSRWGPRVRRHLTMITYTGRRSGRTFSTLVGYQRSGDVVTISAAMPDRKSWWRNFLGEGGPITLDLEGADRAGHAVTTRDGKGRVTVTVRLD